MECYLKNLISFSKDGEWGKGEAFDNSVEMYAIRGTDFEDVRFGSISDIPRRHISKCHAERKLLQPWDVLIEAAGGTKNQITGRTVLLRPGLFTNSELPFTCASFSRFIRFNTELCDPTFMFWYLQYLYTSGAMHAYHTQHTGVARFQWTTFSEREPFTIPSLSEQRRIADILSAYDELIENNRRRIRILETMARALYREWFVNFRYPGHENIPFVQSPLGEIPKDWEVKNLAKLVTTKYGYTESANESPIGPKYLRGMDINKTSYIDWFYVPYCQISDEDKISYAVEIGDVFVIRMADPGKVGIVEQEIDAVFASYLIRVRTTDARISPYFLFHLFDSPLYQNYISGASTGTTRKSASAGVITDFQFALPPKNLIATFEAQVAIFRKQLNLLLQQTQNLSRTRDLLLPRLLSEQRLSTERCIPTECRRLG